MYFSISTNMITRWNRKIIFFCFIEKYPILNYIYLFMLLISKARYCRHLHICLEVHIEILVRYKFNPYFKYYICLLHNFAYFVDLTKTSFYYYKFVVQQKYIKYITTKILNFILFNKIN